ncbi:helix-turn-helix domain-containing protein [Roseivivax sp. CAU 1761]
MDTPWFSALNHVMTRIIHAESWIVELKDRNGALPSVLAKSGNLYWQEKAFQQAIADLEAATEFRRKTRAWAKRELICAKGEKREKVPRRLFLFLSQLATGETLRGGLVLDHSAYPTRPNPDGTDILNLIAAIGAGAAHEIRLQRERWAAQRLFSLLAFDCLIVNTEGRVVFRTPKAFEALGLNGGRCEQAFPLKGLLRDAQEQYWSGAGLSAQRYHIATVEGGGGDALPFYVLPLPKEDSEPDPKFLAVVVPRETDPPSDEALIAILSLTPAEAKVVRSIVAGSKVRAIAEEMSLAEQSVRTYLKRAYGKIGVSSQCELIARVNALSIPLRAGS